MQHDISPVLFTANESWCKSAPLGWTYVLGDQNGFIKIGHTITSLKQRDRSREGYSGFNFIIAFAGEQFESILHENLEDHRYRYKPLDDLSDNLFSYKTHIEVAAITKREPTKRYRRTKKELFRFDNVTDLKQHLVITLKKLGYYPLEMKTSEEALPYDSFITKEILKGEVYERAIERVNNQLTRTLKET